MHVSVEALVGSCITRDVSAPSAARNLSLPFPQRRISEWHTRAHVVVRPRPSNSAPTHIAVVAKSLSRTKVDGVLNTEAGNVGNVCEIIDSIKYLDTRATRRSFAMRFSGVLLGDQLKNSTGERVPRRP